MRKDEAKFGLCFRALTDYAPLPWQERLHTQMVLGRIPRACDLPTGLGKTSVIAIWLIALCHQAIEGRITLPRRLIYIVNRRTVVDQATTIVEQIQDRLWDPSNSGWSECAEVLITLRTALGGLSSEKANVLAVSTLRGELADNEEWKVDPARAAVIVGTIDMIGSKLLFSGYGDGRYKRPQHAGLIGQDSLIVHDEAHLTPAFSELLRSVSAIQAQERDCRPVFVMELSATQRGDDVGNGVLQLEPDDEVNRVVSQRISARKVVRLHKSEKKAQNLKLAECAFQHEGSGAKVLVYVRSPEDAGKIANDLKKRIKDMSGDRVALLTGTIRGYERDRLVVDNPVYKQMLDPEAKPSETVYMVSTSAGEVGIDIDADHMVCDLAPLDSLVQRLGRVNRRGGYQREAQVDLIWTEEQANPGTRSTGFKKAVAKTLELLKLWGEESDGLVDASPRNVRDRIDNLSAEDRAEAFSPVPAIREVTDILLDSWSLTSVDDMPGRPEVAPYLHGDMADTPETYIAWRWEVGLFSKHGLAESEVSDWFSICPILSYEKVRGQSDKVKADLRRLLREHRKKDESSDFKVVLLDNRNKTKCISLSEILDSADRQLLNYKTLVLPTEIGGLAEEGMLDSKNIMPIEKIDVAEQGKGDARRKRIRGDDLLPYGWKVRDSVIVKEADEGAEVDESELRLNLAMPERELAIDDHEQAKFDMTLASHTAAIVSNVTEIGKRVGLKTETVDALALASEWHDRGKNRDIWQRYAGKNGADKLYAKSENYGHGRELAGYRHELGSLMDAMRDEAVSSHPERDLILHLIASHHGRARPNFGPESFDKERYTTRENTEAVNEAMQRFGRLQKRYGRWGLAWLEALMRCADIAASQPPGGFKDPQVVEEETCKPGV